MSTDLCLWRLYAKFRSFASATLFLLIGIRGVMAQPAPTLISAVSASSSVFSFKSTEQLVTVGFNTAMNPATAPIIRFSGSVGVWTLTTSSWNAASDVFSASFSYGAPAMAEEAVVAVAVENTAQLLDAAGNIVDESASNTSTTFTLDTRLPQVVRITTSPMAITTRAHTLTVEVQYSEAMDLRVEPSIHFSAASNNFSKDNARSDWKITNGRATSYEAIYTYNANVAEEVAAVLVTASGGIDLAGNAAASMQEASSSFSIDTSPPTVSVKYDKENVANGQSVQVTAMLSEPIKANPPLKIEIRYGGNVEASVPMNKVTTTQYIYSYKVAVAESSKGEALVSINDGEDASGNVVTVGRQGIAPLTIDNQQFTVSELSPPNNSFNVNPRATLSITFNKPFKSTGGEAQLRNEAGGIVQRFNLPTTTTADPSKTLVLVPILPLIAGERYSLTLPKGVIVDENNNDFEGIEGSSASSSWQFTVFAPLQIASIHPRNGTASACALDTIEVSGSALMGVTEAHFGGAVVAVGSSVIPVSDQLLKVVVPLSAKEGPLMLVKPASNGNTESTATSGVRLIIGPTLATLSGAGNLLISNVCSTGATTATAVKVEIKGGQAQYTVKYKVEATVGGARFSAESTESNYQSENSISVTPPYDNATHTISLASVVDAGGCAVPSSQLLGSFIVTRNMRPAVSTGAPMSVMNASGVKEVSVCLSPLQNTITVNSSILGGAPQSTGAAGVIWTTAGRGVFRAAGVADASSSNLLEPTYVIATGDLLAGGVKLTIATTGNPAGCEASSDMVLVKFSSDLVADAGGDASGTLYYCWDGKNNMAQVQLHGSIANARRYKWSAVAPAGGVAGSFSDASARAPIYTLSADEIRNKTARVALTAEDGSCGAGGGSSTPDNITIVLVSNTAKPLVSPKVNVCAGEQVSYTVSNPNPNSTFRWRTVGGAGQFVNTATPVNNLPTTSILWQETTLQKDTIAVSEIDQRGCEGEPYKIGVKINTGVNPGLHLPVAFSFARVNSAVELLGNRPSGDTDDHNTMEFIGDGVVSVREPGPNGNEIRKYYFSPQSLWDLTSTNSARKFSQVSYRYRFFEAGCYTQANIQEFLVYDGSQAFSVRSGANGSGALLQVNAQNEYEICGDQPVRISINPGFLQNNPLQQGKIFNKFSLDQPANVPYTSTNPQSPFMTTVDAGQDPNSNYAILYPDRLEELNAGDPQDLKPISFPITLRITGWQKSPSSSQGAEMYGSISIKINPVPKLAYNPIEATLCSSTTSVPLTKNETQNPGNLYSFFVKDSAAPDVVLGTPINGFSLVPDRAFPQGNASYLSPKDIEVFYTYQDNQGCNDTTSFVVKIIQAPPQPSISEATQNGAVSVLCAPPNHVPAARVGNRASFVSNVKNDKGMLESVTTTASVQWYSSPDLIDENRVGVGLEFTPPAAVTSQSGKTRYYVLQEIARGCVSPTRQVDFETLDAPKPTWNKSCIDGEETEFSLDLERIGVAVREIVWSLRSDPAALTRVDASSLRVSNFRYTFATPGIDSIAVMITSESSCVSKRADAVVNLKKTTFGAVSNLYEETFDQGNGGFVATSDPSSEGSACTWAYGVIDNKPVRPKTPNTTPLWVTSLDGYYDNGERSYLYVGCLDLSTINLPIVGFRSWTNTDGTNDGVVLQYAVDSRVVGDPNKQWKAVGRVGDGLGWYNRQLIQSIPNNDARNNYGWSSNDEDWVTSRHSLQEVKSDQVSSPTIFRFVFAATKTQAGKEGLGGFAIDNFFVGEQTRTVLVESFFNKANLATSRVEETQSATLKEFLADQVGMQLVKVNYHVGFPEADPFNLDEPAGPSARALFYGVKAAPITLIDGNAAPQETLGNRTSLRDWLLMETSIRSLEPSLARIAIESQEATEAGEQALAIRVHVTPNVNFRSGKPKLYIALLENEARRGALPSAIQELIKTNETAFDYVFKKMFPSPSGLETGLLEKDKQYTFGPFYWHPDPGKLYSSPPAISIVAFVQNETDRSIYQTAFRGNVQLPSGTTPVNPPSPPNPLASTEQVQVYPNPADEALNVLIAYGADSGAEISLASPVGSIVWQGRAPHAREEQKIDILGLKSGVYLLRVGLPHQPAVYRKVIIQHEKQ